MRKLQFFTGDRLVSDFVIKLHGGDVDLGCKITERWVEKLARSVNCGRSRELTLKKTVGVTLTRREELEATISSSLGKGVAELKSEIRSKSGIEISFEVTQEEEEKFPITSPKCGRTTFRAYQLLRLYNFSYKDNRNFVRRFFSPLKKAPRALDEWLNQIYDATATDEVDPDCLVMHPECRRAPQKPPEGFINLIFENFGLLTGYRTGEQGIVLTKLNATVPAKNIEELLHSGVTFDRSMIPSHLLFLSGEGADRFTARVLPYRGELAIAERISRESRSQGRRAPLETAPAGVPAIVVGGAIAATVTLLLTTESGRAVLRSIVNAVGNALGPGSEVPEQRGVAGATGESSLASNSQGAQSGPAHGRTAVG